MTIKALGVSGDVPELTPSATSEAVTNKERTNAPFLNVPLIGVNGTARYLLEETYERGLARRIGGGAYIALEQLPIFEGRLSTIAHHWAIPVCRRRSARCGDEERTGA